MVRPSSSAGPSPQTFHPSRVFSGGSPDPQLSQHVQGPSEFQQRMNVPRHVASECPCSLHFQNLQYWNMHIRERNKWIRRNCCTPFLVFLNSSSMLTSLNMALSFRGLLGSTCRCCPHHWVLGSTSAPGSSACFTWHSQNSRWKSQQGLPNKWQSSNDLSSSSDK